MKKNILLTVFCLLGHLLSAQQNYNINFIHDGKTVYGTFKVPAGNKRFKTIIINAGSGANDRYGTLPMVGANVACLYPGLLNDTLKPYDELSDALRNAGYAVLIYDKLEFTYPTSLGTITFHKLWLPVESAIGYVKTRVDVDTNNIILLGHSEGSSLIPFIAKKRKDVKALISVAGPRTPFDSLLAYQIVYMTQTCGGDVSQAQAQAKQILDYFHLIRTNAWNSSTPALFGAPAKAWYDYVKANDPVADNYDTCHLPTLFLGFDKDINVPPAELQRFKSEVSITNDFWHIPSLIHYMTTNSNKHIARVVPDTIIYWLRNNGLQSDVNTPGTLQRSVKVQPNPFVSGFSVLLDHSYPGDIRAKLCDMTGRELMSAEPDNYQISFDTHEMQTGVYLLQVWIDGQWITKKIIKQ
jgi:hypothetical protein